MTAELAAVPAGPVVSHVYEPRGSARVLLECRDRDVLVSGPAGTGKSRACLEKMLYAALLNGNVDEDGQPLLDDEGKPKRAFRGLIARKVGTSLTSTTLATWKEHVAAEALASGVCVYYGGSREEPAQYRFANGSKIMVTGLDNPTKIMSSEFDVVYVGEATELEPRDWEFISTRLRNGRLSFQQIIADCNPGPPNHWLKKRGTDGKTLILYSGHWENPRYYDLVPAGTPPIPATGECPEREVIVRDGETYRMTVAGAQYIVGVLRALSGVRRDRLHDGLWVAAEGMIYDEWDPTLNLVDRMPASLIPRDWPRYWSVDFGFTNPFVAQWWAEDPDGRLLLYREIYRTKRLVEDHARDILKQVTRFRKNLTRAEQRYAMEDRSRALREGLVEWTEPEPERIICDHDAEGRATLEKYLDRGTTAAKKEVKRGIEAVQARIRPAGDGIPRLRIMRRALVYKDPALEAVALPTCTEEEIPGYVWEPPKPGQQPKEEPQKRDDHGCDAKRYIVADRDFRIRIRDREIGLEG